VQAQAAQLVTHAARTDVVFFQAEHLPFPKAQAGA
jgi:hypothetical protein